MTAEVIAIVVPLVAAERETRRQRRELATVRRERDDARDESLHAAAARAERTGHPSALLLSDASLEAIEIAITTPRAADIDDRLDRHAIASRRDH
jgi:hypothetical protein